MVVFFVVSCGGGVLPLPCLARHRESEGSGCAGGYVLVGRGSGKIAELISALGLALRLKVGLKIVCAR